MRLKELYRIFLKELEKIYIGSEAASITGIIFEFYAGITKAELIKNPDKVLDEKITKKISGALSELVQHKPVQYITGEAWFYNMKLKVSPAVLIPRPETEELAKEVIDYMKASPHKKILDIGAGSGCISIAIKKNIPDANVIAIDISRDALTIAGENARAQGVKINFLELNFLDQNLWKSLPLIDAIVSNPPYIPEIEKQLLEKNVSGFEPHIALFTDVKRPLIFYEKIAEFGKTHLNKTGKVFVEVHEDYAGPVLRLFIENEYEAVIKKDMFEKERIIIATRCR